MERRPFSEMEYVELRTYFYSKAPQELTDSELAEMTPAVHKLGARYKNEQLYELLVGEQQRRTVVLETKENRKWTIFANVLALASFIASMIALFR